MSQVTLPPRPPQPPGPPRPPQHFLGDVPPVDPRFRRRWAEARRLEGRRRLRALVVLLAVVTAFAGCVGLLHTPLFRVRDVVVRGSTHTPRAEVLTAAGLAGPGNTTLMVDAGPGRAKRAVEALPWVATASFSRHWPWTVVITVEERSPVALIVSGGSVDAVDATGRVLEVVPPHEAPPALPVVLGAQGAQPGSDVSPGTGLARPQLEQLLGAAGATPPALAERRLQLAYFPQKGLVAHVGAGSALVVLGDASGLATKLDVLEELVSRVGLAGYAQVDLTVPERPALTPLLNSGNN
ncbi:MAG: FtsQ-type POTRA domain-containing protein [Acidimicrobiales bacterium]